MAVTLCRLLASDAVVEHELTELIVAPSLHKSELVFVPLCGSKAGILKERFYKRALRPTHRFKLLLGALSANKYPVSEGRMIGQIRLAIDTVQVRLVAVSDISQSRR
jgi:hypothetical protein